MCLIDLLIRPIPLVDRLALAPKEGRDLERLYEFPFIFSQEEIVQDPDRRHQVVVDSQDPAHWYPVLGEVPIKNGKRETMGAIDQDKIDNVGDALP